jgi:hypothetical protein
MRMNFSILPIRSIIIDIQFLIWDSSLWSCGAGAGMRLLGWSTFAWLYLASRWPLSPMLKNGTWRTPTFSMRIPMSYQPIPSRHMLDTVQWHYSESIPSPRGNCFFLQLLGLFPLFLWNFLEDDLHLALCHRMSGIYPCLHTIYIFPYLSLAFCIKLLDKNPELIVYQKT